MEGRSRFLQVCVISLFVKYNTGQQMFNEVMLLR